MTREEIWERYMGAQVVAETRIEEVCSRSDQTLVTRSQRAYRAVERAILWRLAYEGVALTPDTWAEMLTPEDR